MDNSWIGVVIIFGLIGIISFIIDKIKKRNSKSQNEPMGDYQNNIPGFPDNAVFIHENGIMSSQEMKKFILNFQDSISSLIVKHFEGMKRALNDSGSNYPLDRIINMKDDIKYVILEKMNLVFQDGQSHSRAITDLNKTIMVNISCIGCRLHELKEKYEKEVGPYIYLLDNYARMTQQNGMNSFVHIIYCYYNGEQAITAAYLNLSNGVFIKPNELISDDYLNSFIPR